MQATTAKLKMVFARHGIPQVVIADHMPFNSSEFKTFGIISYYLYPQLNGLVEFNVQTIKCLFKKACNEGKEAEMALLEQWSSYTGAYQDTGPTISFRGPTIKIFPYQLIIVVP